jgi:hypothetical protein
VTEVVCSGPWVVGGCYNLVSEQFVFWSSGIVPDEGARGTLQIGIIA